MVQPARQVSAVQQAESISAAPTAMAVISGPAHLVTYADPRLRRWIGEPDPIGRSVNDVVHDFLDLPDVDPVLEKCLTTGEPYHLHSPLQARFRSADPLDRIFVRLTFAPLPRTDAAGHPEIVIVVTDCTDQVLAQRQRERGAAREQVLLRLATASNQVSSTEAKLVTIANSAVPTVADVCAVNLLDHPVRSGQSPGRPITMWRIAAPTSDGQIGPTAGQAGTWGNGDPATAAVAAGRTVVFHYNPADPPPWAAQAGVERAIRDGHVHCTAMVPVAIDGYVHAVIAFGAGPHRAAYDDDDVELFELIAAQTAAAMRQGGQYDTIRSTALTLQRAMLSAPSPVDGLEIAVRYRPAGETAEIGGDWYDVFPLGERDIAVVVGDIAGHDIAAAAIMGQVRSMLRAFAISEPGPPEATLSALDHVIRQLRLTNLATCAYMQIGRSDKHVDGSNDLHITWSNAGHPAPVLVDPDGTTTVLEGARDSALGVADRLHRTSATQRLPRGSTLLLFTDGLFEQRTISLDDCFALLTARIADLAQLPIEEMCDELLRFAPHDDDIALVAVRTHNL